MMPIGRDGFVTMGEAIKSFVLTTTLYVVIIFIREFCAWGTEKTAIEILTPKSYTALLVFGSFLYFGFLVSWGYLVIRSYKRYKNKPA